MSSTISYSLLKFIMFTESVMLSNHLTSFSFCCQLFLVSGSFPMSQLSTSSGQGIGASASASSESESCSVVSNSLQPHGLYSPWNSPGKNTGVGSHSLLQRIFPTQGSNPGFPHCRWILYRLRHQGSPRTLEWVAYPFSRRSSQHRDPTRSSCISGRLFTS